MKHLTLEQRYAIQAYIKSGMKVKFIALELDVHQSTIRRELKRNATKTGKYNANFANELSNERKERFAINRKFDNNMQRIIDKKIIEQQWSHAKAVPSGGSHQRPEQAGGHVQEAEDDVASRQAQSEPEATG